LGHRLNIRSLPQLHFVYEESIEQGTHLSALIEQAVESDKKKHEDEE
jgi:ribosome-binding factor A